MDKNYNKKASSKVFQNSKSNPEDFPIYDEAEFITPNIKLDLSPPFYQLTPKRFEKLCLNILRKENHIEFCELYGIEGQSDFGVDLKAITSEDQIILGECKSHVEVEPKLITNVVNRILEENEDHWDFERVKKIILFLASDIQRTQVHDVIENQIQRLKKHGIDFEVWSARELKDKLMDHPHIVARFLEPADHWINVICEENPNTDRNLKQKLKKKNIVNEQAFERITEMTFEELQEVKNLLKQGRTRRAYEQILNLRENEKFLNDNEVRAEILKIEAVLKATIEEDFPEARKIFEEIDQLQVDINTEYEKFVVLYHEENPSKVLNQLEDPSTIEAGNLILACLLEMNEIKDFWSRLDEFEDEFTLNYETKRLKAIAFLLQENLGKAYDQIEKIAEEEPDNFEVQRTKGIIYYHSAFSPVILPDQPLNPPMPVFRHYLIKDEDIRERLQEAQDTFDELIDIATENEREAVDLEVWKLACKANLDELEDPGNTESANNYAEKLLSENSIHYGAFIWGTARDFNVVNQLTANEVIQRFEKYSPGVNEVIGLLVALLSRGNIDDAIWLHEESKEIFGGDSKELWKYWKARILLLQGEYEKALDTVQSCQDLSYFEQIQNMSYHRKGYEDEKYEDLEEYLESKYKETERGDFLYELCELKAQQGDWEFVYDHKQKLIEKVMTDSAKRMAVAGAFNSGRPRETLRMLGEYYDE